MAPTYKTLIDGEINWLLMVTGKKKRNRDYSTYFFKDGNTIHEPSYEWECVTSDEVPL